MSEGAVIGIDLGTTNSLAAVRTDKGARVLRDRDGEALIPSIVCYAPDGEVLVGRKARAQLLVHPDRTIRSIKRLIGRSGAEVLSEAQSLPYRVQTSERGLPRIRIGDRALSPEEVSAQVLSEVKRTAEAALGGPVRAAVITVPAYFDDAQRQATKDAASLAGIECLRILNEPTAASLAYGIDGTKDGTVLVYDLGGGTFDVSVLRVDHGVFRVLATAGDTRLGGDDFDRLVADRLLESVPASSSPSDPFVLQTILAAAEEMKFKLGTQDSASLELDLGPHGTAAVTLTRSEFEAMIEDIVERTMTSCRLAMRDAGVKPKEIDHVLLVGGSTRVPLVRRRLEEAMGKAPRTDVDPDFAVALGAAIQADVLAGNDRDLLLDVIPLSLGIETLGGAVQKLILRNATIPTTVTEEFSTAVDGQTAVTLNILQGEREMARDCRHLATMILQGIPPMPAGLPRIAVTFLVDADGVLRVTAREQRTGIEAGIRVVPSFGLTREEVARMMQDAIENAQRDFEVREAVDLENKARAMLLGTRKALQMADLPPDRTWSIQKCLKNLAVLLDGPHDAAQLRSATDELTRLTADVADDVIGAAVKKALQEDSR
ncbi:MAG: Fe-S protein assembly chaperone HscA [Planctomycetota bacterium]